MCGFFYKYSRQSRFVKLFFCNIHPNVVHLFSSGSQQLQFSIIIIIVSDNAIYCCQWINKNIPWWQNMKTTTFLSVTTLVWTLFLRKANDWKLTCRKAIAPQCRFKSLTPAIPWCVSDVITRQHCGRGGQCCSGLGGLANCLFYVCLSAPQINVA